MSCELNFRRASFPVARHSDFASLDQMDDSDPNCGFVSMQRISYRGKNEPAFHVPTIPELISDLPLRDRFTHFIGKFEEYVRATDVPLELQTAYQAAQKNLYLAQKTLPYLNQKLVLASEYDTHEWDNDNCQVAITPLKKGAKKSNTEEPIAYRVTFKLSPDRPFDNGKDWENGEWIIELLSDGKMTFAGFRPANHVLVNRNNKWLWVGQDVIIFGPTYDGTRNFWIQSVQGPIRSSQSSFCYRLISVLDGLLSSEQVKQLPLTQKSILLLIRDNLYQTVKSAPQKAFHDLP
ncbi:MAG: hypothetical protein Q7T11_01890 [Deltaproteobacteria bacterium]|nr:hypothetical protein [Deltaproteobacteria bacterium]